MPPAAHDTLTTALRLAFDGDQPVQASGTLADANQVDLYAVPLRAGDEVTAGVHAQALAEPAACLRIFDAGGRQRAFQENTAALDTGATFDAAASGVYYIGISSNGNFSYDPSKSGSGVGGATTGAYTLSLTRRSILVAEIAPNDTLRTAQPLTGNTVLEGRYVPDTTAYYVFHATAGGRLTASVTAEDGNALSPMLALDGDAGQLLISANASAPLDQHLQPGTYFLAVTASVTATVNTGSGNLGYILDTTFVAALAPFAPVPVATNPQSVAAGDLDHDGNLDLITVSSTVDQNAPAGRGMLSAALGNGEGSFQPATVYPVGNGADGVALGDFNRDGTLDAVTANFVDNTVSVLLGRGDGSFLPVTTYAVGRSPQSVAVGDFNGYESIITANAGDSTVSVLLGQGDGTFQSAVAYPVGASPASVAVGDFNGHEGIVTANAGDSTVSVLLGQGDGTFLPAASYAVGRSPRSVAVGDFNGDGSPDLVTANSRANTVSILLSRGNGTFLSAFAYAVGHVPDAVAVGDFNGDGHPDVVAANSNDKTVSMLLGRGSGRFQSAVAYGVEHFPDAVAVGDFNGDQHLDLASANRNDDSVSVLPGRGEGTLMTAVPFAAGSRPYAVAVGDFNHDGNVDLVTANGNDDTLSVSLGQGNGAFLLAATYPVGQYAAAVAVGDFNGDTNPDLVSADFDSGTVSVLLGRGDGTFLPAASYAVGLSPHSVAVGDFNDDGHPDLVTADSGSGTVSVLLGRGDGTFQNAVPYAVGPVPYSVAVGDVNGDGDSDLVSTSFGSSTVSVLLGRGNGRFEAAAFYAVGLSPYSVALGDFNDDGQLDLVTANFASGTVSVLLNQGNGRFLPAAAYAVGRSPRSLAVGDFNGDGNPDLVCANFAGSTVSVLQGMGDGTFVAAAADVVGVSPNSVAVGDLNDDGNVDLVAADTGDSTVSVLLGRGEGTFRTASSYAGASRPFAVAVGDFNGDSNLDLVTANGSNNTVSISLGQGKGTFLPAASYAVGSGAFAVAVGDFNNDTNLDLVTAGYDSGTVSVRLGRGDGRFLPAASYPVGRKPHSVAVGDVNGDGNLDIVTADSNANTVSVLLGRGDGTFQPATAYAVGPAPYSVALGDFDGDGHLDLVTANFASGTVSVLLGRGDGTFQPAKSAMTFKVGPSPYSVALGNFNGDGRLDLVTANYGNNKVSVLLGRGDGTFQVAAAYAVGLLPRSVAVADSNGDGHLDLVTANYGSSTLSVLLNRGNGTFLRATTYAVGVSPGSVAVGDLNDDGNVDLVTANSGDSTTSVLLGHATTFENSTSASAIAIRNAPLLQDLNGDGIPDSVILNSAGVLLFRPGQRDAAEPIEPPLPINPADRPARDVTLVQTAAGWAVAAVDTRDNQVSVYTWDALTGSFEGSARFGTGLLPVHIAAADLNGDRLADLVVANDFDNSVTIAFQTPSGLFGDALTHRVGVGPSDIAFANRGGPDGPDIVVSDQVSGDYSVLFNDPAHSFVQQSRYRAAAAIGAGPFDVSTDPNDGEQTILGSLQTVAVVAGHFTNSGGVDLILVNRNAKSFTLVPNLGQGNLGQPQPTRAYRSSAQPGQAVALTLPGDRFASVAILMQDQKQIWLYRDTNGTFAAPVKIPAGNAPSGLSVAMVDGQLALLVGNPYGDILTLLYGVEDGIGTFAPDRTNLRNNSLVVGTVPGTTNQQYVVAANQSIDQVASYIRVTGTHEFRGPIPISSKTQPLKAPGAVQLFQIGDAATYLVVANSLGNDLLIYRGLGRGQFTYLGTQPVGFYPSSITRTDINGDGVPDLLVANRGSDDVSVLIGSINPATGLWTATPYQRLPGDGSGLLAAVVRDTDSTHGPDLLVATSDGQVVLYRGIGSDGRGSGFFQGGDLQTFVPPGPIPEPPVPGGGGGVFVPGPDGSVRVLVGNSFALLVNSGVTTLAAVPQLPHLLVVGLDDGSIELLNDDGAILTSENTGFGEGASALQVLVNGDMLDVYATAPGNGVPIIVSLQYLSDEPPVPTGPAGAQPIHPPQNGAPLRVPALVPGGLEDAPAAGPVTAEAAAAPPALAALQVAFLGDRDAADRADDADAGPPRAANLPLATAESLRQWLRDQQMRDNRDDARDPPREEAPRPRQAVPPPPEAAPQPAAPTPEAGPDDAAASPEPAAALPSSPTDPQSAAEGPSGSDGRLIFWLLGALGAARAPLSEQRGLPTPRTRPGQPERLAALMQWMREHRWRL